MKDPLKHKSQPY